METDKKNMKVIISGADSFNDYEFLKRTLYSFLVKQRYLSIEILTTSGTRLGLLGRRFASSYGLTHRYFITNTKDDGNLALIKKNNRIFDYATKEDDNRVILFSFQDKDKLEDKSMVSTAIKLGVEIYQVSK